MLNRKESANQNHSEIPLLTHQVGYYNKQKQGLPWWYSGKESTFQFRGTGLIPGRETKIPHAAGQLSLHLHERAHVPQTTEPTRPGARGPQVERENPHATTREKPTCCNERSRMLQLRPDTDKKIKKINQINRYIF